MLEGWQREAKTIRETLKMKEDEWAAEREQLALKHKSVLKLQQALRFVSINFCFSYSAPGVCA
jgi:hypothetical protein